MAFVSPRMSLKIWSAGADPYDHEQLADNFLRIDQHDHSPGRGTLITGAGIADGSITATHIYPGALGTDNLADGSITTDKIDSAVYEYVTPLGTVIDWWRPSSAYDAGAGAGNPPVGYAVCDGRTLTSGQHGFGSGSITLPDLRNKFVLGADITKTDGSAVSTGGDLVADSPGIGGVSGSNRVSLATSEIAAHSHTISGSISNTDLSHSHSGTTGVENSTLSHVHNHQYDQVTDMVGGTPGGGQRNVSMTQLYFTGSGPDPKGPLYSDAGGPANHTHNFSTGGASVSMSHSHPHTLSINNTGSGSAHENRPRHVGLLKIMKVKHPV